MGEADRWLDLCLTRIPLGAGAAAVEEAAVVVVAVVREAGHWQDLCLTMILLDAAAGVVVVVVEEEVTGEVESTILKTTKKTWGAM